MKIVPKELNPSISEFEWPEYDGEEHSPAIEIYDKDTGELIFPDEITWTGDTEATNVSEKELEISAIVDGGNYTGGAGPIPWNITPKAITISIAEEKDYDGETFVVDGNWPTGVKNESFDYQYETISAENGVYTLDEETVIGDYFETSSTHKINYEVTQDVALTIVGAPGPQPQPEPTPVVPEYIPGQTGDNMPIAGIAIISLTLIGAFLFLRRSKKVNGSHIR